MIIFFVVVVAKYEILGGGYRGTRVIYLYKNFFHPFFLILFFFLVLIFFLLFSLNSLSRNRNFRNKIRNHGEILSHMCHGIHILSRILPIKSAIRSQILLSLRYCTCICMYIRYCQYIYAPVVQNVTQCPLSSLISFLLSQNHGALQPQ